MDWIAAMALLREIQQLLVKAEVIIYSATIGAYELGLQWIPAVALLRVQQQLLVQADVII